MDKIIMEHGSGGSSTGKLIADIFEKAFDNRVLSQMEDSAVLENRGGRIAMTTDSFVVNPLEFPGGDIGRLSVCGTVNDLLMRGARPAYLTCGFILQEGLDIELLKRIVKSMADTAREAGVAIIAGDTKVVEGEGGMFINTAGVGFIDDGVDIGASNAKPGDVIIVSGNMGDHHATILSQRMGIKNSIESDNAPLSQMVTALIDAKIKVNTLRDVTRGGLATVLKELAEASSVVFEIKDSDIPVSAQVKDFCGLLGLDPLYMGNEGKLVAIVDTKDANKALEIIKASKYGSDAVILGEVVAAAAKEDEGKLFVKTRLGGKRSVDVLQGEGLPRIC